jgi:rod shape-determining protein MreC
MRNVRRARLVLTLLLLAAFTLITLDYRSHAGSGLRRAGSSIFGPIENVVSDIVDPIGSFFASIGHLSSYKHQNADLRGQLAQLRTELRLSGPERAELAQEQKLLHLAGLGQFTVAAARITAYGSGLNFESTVTIDRGSASGIQVDQTVIAGAGLVGRVVTVGHSSATVLLENDSKFVAGARLSTKGEDVGSVAGGGRGQPLTLTLFDNTVPLTVGQQIVTFGDQPGGPFVPEVPIGQVTAVTPQNGQLGQTATVKPFVNLGSLDIVMVVVKAPRVIKHDLLLPKSPTPAPTVTVTETTTPGAPGSTASPGASTSPGSTATTTPPPPTHSATP